MSTVYITQPAVHRDKDGVQFAPNYDSAKHLGPLVRVIESRPLILDSNTLASLNYRLRDFTIDDYLLLSGDPLACALCAIAASRATGGPVRMLRYDKRSGGYSEYFAEFPEVRYAS